MAYGDADPVDLKTLAQAKKEQAGGEPLEQLDLDTIDEIELPAEDAATPTNKNDSEDPDLDGDIIVDEAEDKPDPAAAVREEMRELKLERIVEKRQQVHARAETLKQSNAQARNYVGTATAEMDTYRLQRAEFTAKQDWAAVGKIDTYLVEMERNVRSANETLAATKEEWDGLVAADAKLVESESKLRATKDTANPAQRRFLNRNTWFDPNPNTTDAKSKQVHAWSGELASKYRVDADTMYEVLERRIAKLDPKLKPTGSSAGAARRTVSAGGSGSTAGAVRAKIPEGLKIAIEQAGVSKDKAAVARMVASYNARMKIEKGR